MTTSQEIWSTRLQREILALSDTTSPPTEKSDIGILPAFISYHEHDLDISKGICKVSFAITVEGIDRAPKGAIGEDAADLKAKVDKALGGAEEAPDADADAVDSVGEGTEAAAGSEEEANANVQNDDESTATEATDSTQHTSNTTPAATIAAAPSTYKARILVTFDASRSQTPTDSYPFFKPKAILTSGAEHFTAIQIKNGDQMYIDCDWTPSLHLNDAALNIALKVRESIKRGEPCLKVVREEPGPRSRVRGASVEEDLLEEVKKDFSKAGAKVSSFFSDLKTRASAVAEELDHAVGSASTSAGAGASAAGVPSGADVANNSNTPQKPKRKVLKKFVRKEKPPKPAPVAKIVTIENIAMGDEIDLAMDPWNKAVGMFPCKAIRRPAFVSAAMQASGQNDKVRGFANEDHDGNGNGVGDGVVTVGMYGHQQQCAPDNYMMLHSGGVAEVATAGLTGATSMFRSFTKSAKSVLEESFLMLTEELIIEIRCNKFSVANATVSFAIPVSHLAKLKFRREESLSLFFKQAPDDPIIYMCLSSAEAVKQIQHILKRHGVKGKHTNATMQKSIQSAIEMIEAIQSMEKELEENTNPTKEKVTFIMDLYRQAAEKFEVAGDARHEEVMKRMRDFLAKPRVSSILDGSFESKEAPQVEQSTEIPKETSNDLTKDEVSEAAGIQQSSDDPNDESNAVAEVDEDMEKAMKAAETMLTDAHKDLEDIGNFDFEDEEEHRTEIPETKAEPKEGVGDDVISEFEDMLKDADKELEELMAA